MKDPYAYSSQHTQQDPHRATEHNNEEAPLTGSSLKSPSHASVRKVLDYSRSLEVLGSGENGSYELNRN